MNMSELKALDSAVLTCKQVASVLKCSEQTLHMQAQQKPEMLGFPVVCIGNRVKIPRIPFINYIEGKDLCKSGT